MTRPRGVEITTWLMAISLLVGMVYTATHWNSVADIHLKPNAKATVESVRIFRNVAGLVFPAIAIAVMTFYWKGNDNARTLVLLECVGCLLGLRHLPAYWHASYFFYDAEALFDGLLAIFLLWYLFQPDIRAWFKEQTLLAYRARRPKPT
jgi:hypothetical protein